MKNQKLRAFLLVTAVLAVVFAFSAFAASVGDVAVNYDDSTVAEDNQLGYNYKLIVSAVDESGEATAYRLEIEGIKATAYSKPTVKDGDTSVDYFEYNDYRDKITYVKIGGTVTMIDGSSFVDYKNITTVELSSKVNTIGGIAFEYCTNLKTIFITGNTPVEGTFDLSKITKFSSGYIFDGCKYVENIIFSTEGDYYLMTEFLKANEKLETLYIPSNVRQVSPAAFSNCKALKYVYFEGETELVVMESAKGKYPFVTTSYGGSRDGEPQKVTISAPRGSSAAQYAADYGCTYVTPTIKTLMCGGTKLAELDIVNGFRVPSIYKNGNEMYFVFKDEACNVLAGDVETSETGDTVYAKKLLDFLGYMVRIKDYHGLRALYEFDTTLFDSFNNSTSNNYEITEVGVLGEQYLGARLHLDLDRAGVSKTVIYTGSTLTGSLVYSPEKNGGMATFAYTAVGYGSGSSVSKANAAQEIMFCAYVKVKNTATGTEQVIYSDVTAKNLDEACDATLASDGASKLTASEQSFIKTVTDLGADKTKVLSKDQILSAMTSTYSGANADKIIVGQHISMKDYNTVDTILERVYEHTGGYYPAMIEIDIGEMLNCNRVVATENGDTGTITPQGYSSAIDVKGYTIEALFEDEFEGKVIEDLIEYSRHGGIVGISAHYYNPLPIQTINNSVARGRIGVDNWDVLLDSTSESDIRKNYLEQLEYTYKVMKALQDAGVSVVWRPYHETNGAWFWFTAATMYAEFGNNMTKAVEYYNKLYNMTYDYFETEKGLTNLIWAISPNIADDSSTTHTGAFIPSQRSFDIAGLDWYMGGTLSNPNNDLINDKLDRKQVYSKLSNTGKIVALTEWGISDGLRGSSPETTYTAAQALQLIKDMRSKKNYSFSYIVFWASWTGAYMSTYEMAEMDTFMQDATTIDLKTSKTLFYNNYIG